jgi:hypothetical protein
MADLVFDVGSQFGEGFVVAFGFEDRVIAEALCPAPLTGDVTLDDAFEQMFLFDTGASTGTDILLLY